MLKSRYRVYEKQEGERAPCTWVREWRLLEEGEGRVWLTVMVGKPISSPPFPLAHFPTKYSLSQPPLQLE